MPEVGDILEREEIKDFDKDIRLMSKRDLRKHFRFKTSRKLNPTKLIKNLIWQTYTWIRGVRSASMCTVNMQKNSLPRNLCPEWRHADGTPIFQCLMPSCFQKQCNMRIYPIVHRGLFASALNGGRRKGPFYSRLPKGHDP